LNGGEHALEINAHRVIEVLLGNLDEGFEDSDSGISEDDVQPVVPMPYGLALST
jgi:hypothetical protein